MSDDAIRSRPALDRRVMGRLAHRAQRLMSDRLGRDLYSTPAWDMLLDLYLREERSPMSLTSLSGASLAPSRTGFRAIDRLVHHKLLIRTRDEDDGRRINVELSPAAIDLLDQLFDDLANLLAPP